jgi:signal transduction histidine kinase
VSLVETRSRAAAFEHLLAAVTEPVLVVDAAGAPVRANAAGRLLVPTPDGPRDDRTLANLDALRAFAGRPEAGSLSLLDPAGERVAYTVSVGPAEDGERAILLRDPRERIPAAVSHALRSPLTAILGYASLLLRGLGGSLSPKQQDKLERIHSNGQRLLQLIDERRA